MFIQKRKTIEKQQSGDMEERERGSSTCPVDISELTLGESIVRGWFGQLPAAISGHQAQTLPHKSVLSLSEGGRFP